MTTTKHHTSNPATRSLCATNARSALALPLRHVVGVVGALVVVGSGCEPAQHPRNLTRTFVANACHVAYDCCTAVERTALSTLRYADKASCMEEFDALFGGALDAATEAVDRGTATFDAEAAQACTTKQQAAIDRCEGGAAFVGADGTLSLAAAGFAIDATDPECAALLPRGFTRGAVDDGDDCVSRFECADFGECIIDDDNGAKITRSGTCRASAGKGDDCSDRPCLPGLVCVSGSCDEAPEPLGDGEPCVADAQCESGLCNEQGDASVCVTPDIDDAICDGRQ